MSVPTFRRRRLLQGALACAATAAVTAPTRADAASTLLARASQALGLSGLQTLRYAGLGYDFAMGQSYSAGDPWPRFVVSSYVRMTDFGRMATREIRVRRQFENPPRGGGMQPIVGERIDDQRVEVGPETPWPRQLELWLTPHGFLRAAATYRSTSSTRVIAGQRYSVVSFRGGNDAQVQGYFNTEHVLERIETSVYNPVLGDMPVGARFAGYREFSGVRFPAQILQLQGGFPVLDVVINDVERNGAVDIPLAVRPAPPPGAAVPAERSDVARGVWTERLADGVELIVSMGYASVVVDLGDACAVVEAAASEERSAVVMAEIGRLFPGKPVRHVINTHQHFDHAAGLRPFAAAGATVVTHRSSADYFRRALGGERRLHPDPRQRGAVKVDVMPIDDFGVVGSGERRVELHHMRGNQHSAGLLVCFLPHSRILIQADLWGPLPPGAPASPPGSYTRNFLENMQRLQLPVARVVPIHYPENRRPLAWDDVVRSVARE